jgi:hypothetical protein
MEEGELNDEGTRDAAMPIRHERRELKAPKKREL